MVEITRRVEPKEFIKKSLRSGEIKWEPKVDFSKSEHSVSLLKDGLPGPARISGFIGKIGNSVIEIKLDYLSGGRGHLGCTRYGLGRGREIKKGGWPPWISYPGSISLRSDGKEVFCEHVGRIRNVLFYRNLLKFAETACGVKI